MKSPFTIDASFPPSLANAPLVAMLTVMSFLAVTLICLQWLYEIIDRNGSTPAPPKSYVRTARSVRLWMVGAALVLTLPRLVTLMLWQMLTPQLREAGSVVSWIAGIPAAGMVVYAWWSDRTLVKTEQKYSAAFGYYPAEPATKMEIKRGLLILGVVFVMAFAITFVRSRPHDAAATAVVELR